MTLQMNHIDSATGSCEGTSWLSSRTATLLLQFVSGRRFSSPLLNINIGIPQVSVLGSILFLMYVNDLSACSNFETTLYADDAVLTPLSQHSTRLFKRYTNLLLLLHDH